MADGVNFVRPHRLELEAAQRLIDLVPSAEMVKFGLNGWTRRCRSATGASVHRPRYGRDMP